MQEASCLLDVDSNLKSLPYHRSILDAESGVKGERGQRASEDLSPLSQRSLLVYSGHKSPFQSDWTRTQRRLYHRVLSGFEFAKKSNDYIRVLTLTSSLDSGDFHKSFEALKKRIKRRFGKFEYIAVKEHTKEGLVHLHLVYRGSFMPQSWLSEQWNEIHKAKIVWVARLYTWKLAKHLAKYFIKEGFGRFWTSWKWVYRGFTKDWHGFVKVYGFDALKYWQRWLRNWCSTNPSSQILLFFNAGGGG